MNACDECLRLENRLSQANDYYVSLVLVEERMVRDGNRETMTFGFVEDTLREAQHWRITAAQDLLVHRGTHEDLILGPRQEQQGSRKRQQSSGLPTAVRA